MEIVAFEKAVIKEINQLDTKMDKTFHNLSKAEHQAVQQLSRDDTIVIKPADKGGATVILPAVLYRNECLRLLGDQTTYKKLLIDPTPPLKNKINTILEEAEVHDWISKQEIDYLRRTHPVTPYFYILPKIHKQVDPPPGRPIVSGIGSLLEPLSQFVDHFLKPLVQNTPTFLRDTTDVLNLLTSIRFDPDENLLISLDVESLYTSIPHNASLEIIEETLMGIPWEFRTPRHFILECAEMAMKENFFRFEDDYYLQVHGISMGSTFAPSVAGLYVHSLESKTILSVENPYVHHIVVWKRYIDDILVIWKGDLNQALSFFGWLNTQDPFLRFTHTVSKDELVFLDLLITPKDGGLKSITFHKPTSCNHLLHFSSFHPRHLRLNLPFGQFLRSRRNCSDLSDYKLEATKLSDKLSLRGYPSNVIQRTQKRARHNPRDALLEKKPKRVLDDRLVCVTTYNTVTDAFHKIILKNWNILNAGNLNLQKPLFANRRSATIGNRLVHTRPKIPDRKLPSALWDMAPVAGHFPCGNCAVCHLTSKSREVRFDTGFTWQQRGFTNCNTANVIYCLKCPCDLLYIGMTTRKVKIRIGEHRSNIRCKKTNTRLLVHFLELSHTPNDLRWTVLESLSNSSPNMETALLEKEQRWVFRLSSHEKGLNDDIHFGQFYNGR